MSNFDEFVADFEKKKKEAEDNDLTEYKLHELEKKELEDEIKTLIKERDSNSPNNSSKGSSVNKVPGKSRKRNKSK